MTQPFRAPEAEDIMIGSRYAFTLSPCDTLQYFKSNSVHRVKNFCENNKHVLDNLFGPSEITIKLRMEISKQSRLHYHGWITFHSDEDIRYFYLHLIPLLQSKYTYDIHPIKEYKENGDTFDSKYPTWKAYVNKQSLWNKWYKINTNKFPTKIVL